MEIFQHEDGLDGHGLEVGQGLHGVGGVVHGSSRGGAGVGAHSRHHGSRQAIGFATALRSRAPRLNRRRGGAAAGAD